MYAWEIINSRENIEWAVKKCWVRIYYSRTHGSKRNSFSQQEFKRLVSLNCFLCHFSDAFVITEIFSQQRAVVPVCAKTVTILVVCMRTSDVLACEIVFAGKRTVQRQQHSGGGDLKSAILNFFMLEVSLINVCCSSFLLRGTVNHW